MDGEQIEIQPDNRQRDAELFGKAKPPARTTVFVVEDDASAREALGMLLEEWGYAPVLLSSAEEAEFAARRRPVERALIDIFLPGRSGTALLSKLRAQFPQAVLVAMSAMDDPAMARRCKGLGADGFISKPITEQALAEAMKVAHRSWH